MFTAGREPLCERVPLSGSAPLYQSLPFALCFPALCEVLGQGSRQPFTFSVVHSFRVEVKKRMCLICLFVVDIPRSYILLRKGIGNGDYFSCGNYSWPYKRAAFPCPSPLLPHPPPLTDSGNKRARRTRAVQPWSLAQLHDGQQVARSCVCLSFL